MKWLPPPRLPSWAWPRQARESFGMSHPSSTGMRSRSAVPRFAPRASAPPRTTSWNRSFDISCPFEPAPRPTRDMTSRENSFTRSGLARSRGTSLRKAAIPHPMS